MINKGGASEWTEPLFLWKISEYVVRPPRRKACSKGSHPPLSPLQRGKTERDWRAMWGQGVRSIIVKQEICSGAGKGQETPGYCD
jgi:hypothetical protein